MESERLARGKLEMLYERITDYLANRDVAGLIRQGAPRDEYMPESLSLMDLYEEDNDLPSLQIREIFNEIIPLTEEEACLMRHDIMKMIEEVKFL